MLPSLPCCVDLPSGGGLVRYGLEELLRGLGLVPSWVGREEARLAVTLGEADDGLALAVTASALDALARPRRPRSPGWIEIDGARWPVPVGPPGEATLGDAAAGAAWWLAGLHETAVTPRDVHGRVPFAATWQAELGAGPGGALRPAVDAVRRRLAEALRLAGEAVPGRTWGGAPWAVALTHDLDAVRTRRVRAALAGLARGQVADAVRRGLGPDRRRDSLDALRAVGERQGGRATWFVKPGAWSPQDVAGSLDRRVVRRLRGWREAGHEVGWHPGYGAHGHPERLAAEARRYQAAFGTPPRLARTHFLRWDAATPAALAAHGVRLDSTLGWAEQPGFRRGTAHPFRLFDPQRDGAGDLWELPLAAMDTTYVDYLGLGPDALAAGLRQVFSGARRSGGLAVVLWHNQLGADTAGWTARLDALDRELGQAAESGARIGPLDGLLAAWLADS